MCEYALENWRRRVEQQSFNVSILRELEVMRLRLERKILSLRVQGNHYEAGKTEKLLAWLKRTEECMRRMLNNQGGKKGGLIE